MKPHYLRNQMRNPRTEHIPALKQACLVNPYHIAGRVIAQPLSSQFSGPSENAEALQPGILPASRLLCLEKLYYTQGTANALKRSAGA